MKLRPALLIASAILLTGVLAGQAQVPGVNSSLQSVFNLVYDNSTMKPTYSSSTTTTMASSATDVCQLRGSATRTVKVRRIIVSAASTAVQSDPVAIIKRSTANSGGTVVTPAVVPYDSQFSLTGAATNTGTAVAVGYIANPTVGTAVGVLADPYLTFSNYTTGVGGGPYPFIFGQLGSPVVLRGVAQSVAVNMSGQSIAGTTISCTFEWTEET